MDKQVDMFEYVAENNLIQEQEINRKAIGVNSQTSRIISYLQAGNALTGLDALKLFGTMKLATRISEARRMGYNIQSKTITTESGKHVARYWMES